MRCLIIASLILGALAGTAFADTQPATIRVTGTETIETTPDRAQLDIAVVTRAKSATEAATANAAQARRVLASLRRALGRTAHIETRSYALHPDYQYPENPAQGQPKLVGYTATNTVEVTLDDLSLLGKAIDVATNAGANQVQNIRFTSKNDTLAQTRALQAAVRDARANAAALAKALDLEILRIASLAESSPDPRPMYEVAMARTATPVVPGTIETTATVTLTVEVRPRATVGIRSN